MNSYNKSQNGVILDGEFLPFTYSLYESGYQIIDDYMAHVELNNDIRVLSLNMTIDGIIFNSITELINYVYGFE